MEIARRCNVSRALSDRSRKTWALILPRKRSIPTRKTGAQATMNTANIGVNRAAPRTEMFEIEQIVRQVATAQRGCISDLRLIAKQRIGRLAGCAQGLPANTPYRDILAGLQQCGGTDDAAAGCTGASARRRHPPRRGAFRRRRCASTTWSRNCARTPKRQRWRLSSWRRTAPTMPCASGA